MTRVYRWTLLKKFQYVSQPVTLTEQRERPSAQKLKVRFDCNALHEVLCSAPGFSNAFCCRVPKLPHWFQLHRKGKIQLDPAWSRVFLHTLASGWARSVYCLRRFSRCEPGSWLTAAWGVCTHRWGHVGTPRGAGTSYGIAIAG